ncbi:MAG TPA: hypothetical protein IAC28_05880 [Candidatus Aphodovivens excrementavium]|nr:hypothetical protein [Candidatus Aphodovivens excrementavium]
MDDQRSQGLNSENSSQPQEEFSQTPVVQPMEPIQGSAVEPQGASFGSQPQEAASAQPLQPEPPSGQPQNPGAPAYGQPQQPGAPVYGQPQQTGTQQFGAVPGAPVYAQPAPQPSGGTGTAALVCGILAIVFCFAPLVGVILGIVAIVLASKTVKAGVKNGKTTGGKICGIAGIALSVIMFVVYLVVGVAAFNAVMESTQPTTVTPSSQYSTGSTSDDSGSSSDADVAYTAEEQAAIDVVTARLDQYKSVGDEAVAEIAALADQGFQEQTGFTMADCGVDSSEYARAVLNGFDYEIDIVSAYEGSEDGFVSFDVTCRDAWGVLDELNSLTSDYTASDEYATSTQEQDMAKMGEMLMQAAQTAPLSDDNYFSIDLVNNGGVWEIDQSSWDYEIDYLFGLA